MRPISFATVLILAAGLALPASGQPLEPAGSPADTRVERSEHPAQHTTPRGVGFAGEFVTMRDEFENYPFGVTLGMQGLLATPASFTGPDGFEWGANQILGQSSTPFTTILGLAGSPVGGNTTQALRIMTAIAQPAGGFFRGMKLRADHMLIPDASTAAAVSFEYYATTIHEGYTVEGADTLAGFIVSRLYWGGVNNADGIGLPLGPLSSMYFLGECPTGNCGFGVVSSFYLARYCVGYNEAVDTDCTPPAGALAGQAVIPPIGAWTRATLEITDDARFRWSLDLMNGQEPFLIGEEDIFAASRLNEAASNTTFASQNAAMYIDNAEFFGLLADVPMPPTLQCPYLDDIEWLQQGLVLGQTNRWLVPAASQLTVVEDGARGRVLARTDTTLNNLHARIFATLLPPERPTLGNDLAVSFDASLTGNAVRAFALFNNAGFVTRVFWGNEDRTVPG